MRLNLKNSTILALAFSCGFYLPAQAQDAGRYDKTIEKAAAKRAAAKIGPLRGLISGEDGNRFVTVEDMRPKVNKKTAPMPTPYSKALQRKPDVKALPPIVMNEAIDQVVTGVAVKFDSNGQPMAHHQEYPRPTVISVASSLLDAMSINPYPGDK